MHQPFQKRISPRKAKFVSTLTVSTLMLLIVYLLTSSVFVRTLKAAESRYIESCSEVLEGYASAIHYYLANYRTSLDSVYDEELFLRGDAEEIQRWIVASKPLLHDDFSALFYIDSNRNAYFHDGRVRDLPAQSSSTEATFTGVDFFVSNITDSIFPGGRVFVMEMPVRDRGGNLAGILCASVKVSELRKISQDIKIGEEGAIYITDRTGKFLVHPSESYIGRDFVPAQEKYRHISSPMIAGSGDSVVETENERGEIVDLFSTRIKASGWTLSVAFPKENLRNIYSEQNSDRLKILLTSAVALGVLMLIELAISDFFSRNQMMEAMFDPLTSLWTRERFERKADALIRRNPKAIFMLIESDIRGFKFINQNYGEDAADKMIYFYSSLLNRNTSRWRGFIARGYADHFYTFIRVSGVNGAMAEFRRSLESVTGEIRGYEIPFHPKFGITFVRPEGKGEITVRKLIGQASFAKSTIRDDMLKPYAIYNSRLLSRADEEHFIETSMEGALERGEFFVMYQPKIRLSDERVVGAEALVRWRTGDDHGTLPPDKFIPLFERNGFIKKLDFYVYEKVFSFLSRQLRAGLPTVPISVNMSRNHNKPERFMSEFMELFHRYEIPPSLVQVEILERSVMDDDTLREITERLHKEGFTVAMDDFGSGESSLNMLTKVPVDVLKFDRDFLRSSTADDGGMDVKSARFIESLLDMSRRLEKETIFEGVETAAQRDFLCAAECDQVQGFFYSPPLSEEDFVQFIKEKMKA